MDISLNLTVSAISNAESKEDKTAGNNLTPISLKKQQDSMESGDNNLLDRQISKRTVTCHPEEKSTDSSVTSVTPFSDSKTNSPDNMISWSALLKGIYQSLYQQNHLEIKAQLNALSNVQIQSLFIPRPTECQEKLKITDSLLELASISNEAGSVFYQVLLDRLSLEDLRHVLLKSFDDGETILHQVCRVMDEPLFKKLEDKFDRQTLLEMVTQPMHDLAHPLAFACLYNKSTYLFETVLHEKRELIEKILKGGPDIDQSLLQFMCSDLRRPYRKFQLTEPEYHHRIKYLLDVLTIQDRLDAILFTGKSNVSALLWACTGKRCISDELIFILTETFSDNQKVDLLTAQAETGHSMVQKCLELKKPEKIVNLSMSFGNPLLRFKVLSICTLEGHSLFQQWLLNSRAKIIDHRLLEDIDHMLCDMDDDHRDLIIAGDRCIWDQAFDCTDDMSITLRQQEQTPIVDAMNREAMYLATFLWDRITDQELQIKLLLYKTKHQTTLLKHIIDNGGDWHYLKNRFMFTHDEALKNSFAAELNSHAITAERFDDADYYFRQISDPKLKDDLFKVNHKCFLLNLCNKSVTDIESFFSQQTSPQCTESVLYILEHSLYNHKPLMEKLPYLIALHKKSGNNDTFVQWATSPQKDKKSPLIKALCRFDVAYCKIHYPERFTSRIANIENLNREACFSLQIFQGMVSMMSEKQIKEFFLFLLNQSSDTLHLLFYKDVLEIIVDALGDSGRAFLELINPETGENVLHILSKTEFIDYSDVGPDDLIDTVNWLVKKYGLTTFLQGRLKNDDSTPLHLLLVNIHTSRLRFHIRRTLRECILQDLFQSNSDLLVDLLKLKDNNGCTPLHKYFPCEFINNEFCDPIIEKTGIETFFKLMHIKDKQGNTVMHHCLKRHKNLHEQYNKMFQTLPAEVKAQVTD